ncbi:helicase [Plasmodium falciparum RAJ116]|uniref:Helicase n=1 Tax=Plasmodium falciparum RAJ116 TaxID=580058 RepID=A0A0L0D1L9_PLAFA|nr:helicase [Plasmodium falciparum RAJ116]
MKTQKIKEDEEKEFYEEEHDIQNDILNNDDNNNDEDDDDDDEFYNYLYNFKHSYEQTNDYFANEQVQNTNTTQFNILQFFVNHNVPSTLDQSIYTSGNLENKDIKDNHKIRPLFEQQLCDQIYFDKHCGNLLLHYKNQQATHKHSEEEEEQEEEKKKNKKTKKTNTFINQQKIKTQTVLSYKQDEMSSSASSTYSYVKIEKEKKKYALNKIDDTYYNKKNIYSNNDEILDIENEQTFFNNNCNEKNKTKKKCNLKDRSLTVIGDDDQSIYSFRGAHINVFYKFLKDLQEKLLEFLKILLLIIEHVEYKNNFIRIMIQGNKIQFHAFKTPSDEISYILSEIIYLKKNYNYKYGDFVILCRTNKTLKETLKSIHNVDIKKKAYKYLFNKFLNDKQNHLINKRNTIQNYTNNNTNHDIKIHLLKR